MMLTLQNANRLLSQSTKKAVLLLCGDAAVREIAMEMAISTLITGRQILWIEAANIFDLYALTETAKRWGIDPHPLLRQLHISRTFTVHQMETLCVKHLKSDLTRYPGALGILSDPLALCWDEELPQAEARRVLRRVAAAIENLRRKGLRLLITYPDMPDHCRYRAGLADLLYPVATHIFTLRPTNEGLVLRETPPMKDPSLIKRS